MPSLARDMQLRFMHALFLNDASLVIFASSCCRRPWRAQRDYGRRRPSVPEPLGPRDGAGHPLVICSCGLIARDGVESGRRFVGRARLSAPSRCGRLYDNHSTTVRAEEPARDGATGRGRRDQPRRPTCTGRRYCIALSAVVVLLLLCELRVPSWRATVFFVCEACAAK